MTHRLHNPVCSLRSAGLALVLLASAPALAQTTASDAGSDASTRKQLLATKPAADKVIAVRYEDGHAARVRVLSVEGERVRFESLILGGSITVTKDLSEFAPGSRLRMIEAVSPTGTFEGHFSLAQRAAGWRLLELAGRHAQLALESLSGREDAAEREAQLRAWAAGALEAAVRRSVDSGDLSYAQHCLKLLTTRVPEQRSEAALSELTELVNALDRQLREIRNAPRQARVESARARELDKQLAPLRERVALGERRLSEAIASSAQTVKSARLAQSAIEAYRAAWSSAQELATRAGEDPLLAEELVDLGERAQEQIVRAALHAAHVLTVQSDFKAALRWTDEVLAIEPDQREALELRRTIQIAAAAAGNIWSWGWALPPSVMPPAPGPQSPPAGG